MIRLANILRDLRKQRGQVQAAVDRLDRAIEALSETTGRGRGRRLGAKRHMSKAARKRIADAQRARWARVRAEKANRRGARS